jgi:hypothetical protein
VYEGDLFYKPYTKKGITSHSYMAEKTNIFYPKANYEKAKSFAGRKSRDSKESHMPIEFCIKLLSDRN